MKMMRIVNEEDKVKYCPKCKQNKLLSSFYIVKTGLRVGEIRSWCKSCLHEKNINSPIKIANRLQAMINLNIRKTANTKLCKRCGQIKEKNKFSKDMDSVDGVQCYCKLCYSKDQKERSLIKNNGKHPREVNKKCSQWLGIAVAERVLAAVFKNVQVMPENNRSFDFICGKGFKIDVKSSCRGHYKNRNDRWNFTIKNNKVADYFLLLAFDSREDLNPEFVWLVPGHVINDKFAINISVTTTDKWKEYEKSIDKVTICCNKMKNGEIKYE
jgi:hypothetical protein